MTLEQFLEAAKAKLPGEKIYVSHSLGDALPGERWTVLVEGRNHLNEPAAMGWTPEEVLAKLEKWTNPRERRIAALKAELAELEQ